MTTTREVERQRIVPIVFTETEWQFLRDQAESFEITIQAEICNAVKLAMQRRKEMRP